ncbi:MAG: phosphoesterase RecJ domain-containing protein, phosphoesterase RecJ domain-containing protein [Candidatus Peregrinibacteria bacterium GW2011_GWF2_33_10]|nr:MAG: phosphoesterase RecJ domain-containing protein, phosphoesterase RecJ domain-containing protein [Candidatus Peregrinibacteria bacterium GW2011_GWF2_33_10]OGJ51260.1 MAG: hypothetical protein A2307_00285 [Candidatus Peregrinibacteria bacterium RIFOXYB2_FULL_33_20]
MNNKDFILSFEEAKRQLLGANKIVIVSHRSPDPDTVGASIALNRALTKLGKTVTACAVDKLADFLNFFEEAKNFEQELPSSGFDLLVILDCGSIEQTGLQKEFSVLKAKQVRSISIDHHSTNSKFADLNIVQPDSAATCEILYDFLCLVGWSIDEVQATALLLGIYYDTGRFMHSNTSAKNLQIAADLLNLGADFEFVVKSLYKTKPYEQLKLWGLIWNRARINDKNIVVSAVTDDDLKSCGAKKEHLSGAIDYMNSIAGTKFCMLLTDDQTGVKASVRTQRDDIDLSKFSLIFGGGGHKKASGFTIPGKIYKEIEVKWRISV